MSSLVVTAGAIGTAAALRYGLGGRGVLAPSDPNAAVGGSVVFQPLREAWWDRGLLELQRKFSLPGGTADSWHAVALKSRARAVATYGANPSHPTYPAGMPDDELRSILRTWGIVCADSLLGLAKYGHTEPASWLALHARYTSLEGFSRTGDSWGQPERTRLVWQDILAAASDADQLGLHDVGIDIPAPSFGTALWNNVEKLPDRIIGGAKDLAGGAADLAGDALSELLEKALKALLPVGAVLLLAYGAYRVAEGS